MLLWLLPTLLAVLATPAVDTTSPANYLILLPRSLLLQTNHNAEVQVNVTAAVRVKVEIRAKTVKTSTPIVDKVLPTGSGQITIRAPFTARDGVTAVVLQFNLQFCGAASAASCATNPQGAIITSRSLEMPLKQSLFLSLFQTDKPIYKPGDVVRFRLFGVFCNTLRPEQDDGIPAIFKLIYIETPSQSRMSQWHNVSAYSGLKDERNYTVPKDPEFGKWKIVAMREGKKEVVTFKVQEYVLPQFVVTLKAPSYLIADQKRVQFSVCATLSTGKPIEGKINAVLYMPGSVRREIKVSYVLNGKETCKVFDEDAKPLQLMNPTYRYVMSGNNNKVMLNSTVTETATLAEVRNTVVGGKVHYTYFKLKLLSEPFFFPNVTNFFSIKAECFDGSPKKGAHLYVEVVNWIWDRSGRIKWGFSTVLTTDQNGIAKGRMVSVPDDRTSVFLKVRAINLENEEAIIYKRDRVYMYRPYLYITLRAFNSSSKTYMRITPFDYMSPQDPCRTKKLELDVTANVPLNIYDLSVVVMARGEIVRKLPFPAKGQTDTCVDTDSPTEGHYRCVRGNKGFQIVCLEGWTGKNCLTPVCKDKCGKGYCKHYPKLGNKCACKWGWGGPNCNRPKSRIGCENGYTANGDDCVCYRGWGGEICNEMLDSAQNPLTRKEWPVRIVPCQGGCKETDPERLHDPNRKQVIFNHNRKLEIPWTASMSPEAQVVVFFEFNGKEIVADSITVKNLDSCYTQSVPTSITFDQAEVRPGAPVQARLQFPEATATCSLSIYDIALSNFGKSTNITLPLWLEYMRRECNRIDPYNPSDFYIMAAWQRCRSTHGGFARTAIHWLEASDFEDASTRFKKAGLIAIGNIELITQPCRSYTFGPVLLDSPVMEVASGILRSKTGDNNQQASVKQPTQEKNTEEEDVQVRSYFPENWLFKLLDPPKSETINLTAPHSMTTYITSFYCVSSKGLGISPPALLRVFKLFYIQLVLPYSMILGEMVKVPVKVYNYGAACHEVTITVSQKPNIRVIGSTSHDLCICSYERKTVFFNIKPTTLTNVQLEISGTQRTETGLCQGKPTTALRQGDAVQRDILIKPAGLPQEITAGDIICAGGRVQLSRPSIESEIAPGSARSTFSVTANIFGPALTNLDGLVMLPMGCGEQNIARTAPSIYVLLYFRSARIRNHALEALARQYIYKGYIRQLKYRTKEFSYAAFVSKNTKGSTWLTVFVVKVFALGKQFVPEIEDSDLINSVKFIKSKQERDGSIRDDGDVYSSLLKGGTGNMDKVAFTAFVVINLVEASEAHSLVRTSAASIVEKAKNFLLRSRLDNDITTPSLARVTYALIRTFPNSDVTKQHLAKLMSRVSTNSDGKYLQAHPPRNSKYRPWAKYNSGDVETTAILMQILYHSDPNLSVQTSKAYARWIIAQRNSRGGWYSTQDTIESLNALRKLAAIVAGINLDVTVTLSTTSSTPGLYQLRPDNKLLLQQKTIPPAANVTVTATGNGCAIVQRIDRFNVKAVRAFGQRSLLEGHAVSTQNPNTCHLATVKMCHRYKQTAQTSSIQTTMLIVKAIMASGWKVTDETFTTLKGTYKEGGLRLAEPDGENGAVLYYDPTPARNPEYKCVEFNIQQVVLIADLKAMQFIIFDYYQPDQTLEWDLNVNTQQCAAKVAAQINQM